MLAHEMAMPWEDREVNYIVKILIMIATVPGLFLVFGVLMALGGMLSALSPSLSPLINLLLFGLALYIIYQIWRRFVVGVATRYVAKNTSYPPSTTMGEMFPVKYQNVAFTRTYGRKGSLVFSDEHLDLHGSLPPDTGTKLMVIAIVTILPMVLFKIGLGIIPALLIASYIGRQDSSSYISYDRISEFELKGRTVSISCDGTTPKKFKFRLDSRDGERFYHELYHRLPESVTEWDDQLHQIFGNRKRKRDE